MKRGKKYKSINEKIEENKTYSIEEALKIVKEGKMAKFDESVEMHVRSGVDPKKGEEQVRGSVILPHGTGKEKKVAVITSTKESDAKKAGADIVAGEDLIEEIKKGNIEFAVLIATPEMMPKLAQIARVLGPKGLMPNPKTDTVTEKIKEAVEMQKKGKVDFKNDNTSNIHQVFGKMSFDENSLKENFEALAEAIVKAKPAEYKGKYIIGTSVCSTMGPGIKTRI